ncbi:DUF6520 family protein [Flavobacterium pectinovorum]|jgi:hypothetical protein|uniref:DUF333 domain-containing protein n=1 Tax=Flavobacterium pectinovorum TaxID=29533 RepID=A0A502F4J9_9FLAO|nr:DUF6520 family protein [Flavobacterium pectinovorum]TPG44164.1 hypothetical protein EAH81_06360 [Flavobacterium pectinovorum]
MKNLVKIIMPVGAFILASAGAVSTNAGSSKSTADIQGYNRNSLTEPCEEVRLCNNQGTQICTLAGDQAFEQVGANCSKVLYHKN